MVKKNLVLLLSQDSKKNGKIVKNVFSSYFYYKKIEDSLGGEINSSNIGPQKKDSLIVRMW